MLLIQLDIVYYLSGPTFSVDVQCADGYETSDTLSATACTTNGPYTINGTCTLQEDYYLVGDVATQCPSVPGAAADATLRCTTADDSVVDSCADGYLLDEPDEDTFGTCTLRARLLPCWR